MHTQARRDLPLESGVLKSPLNDETFFLTQVVLSGLLSIIPCPSRLHPQNLCSLLQMFLSAWPVANSSVCLGSVGTEVRTGASSLWQQAQAMEPQRLGLFPMGSVLSDPGSFLGPFPGGPLRKLSHPRRLHSSSRSIQLQSLPGSPSVWPLSDHGFSCEDAHTCWRFLVTRGS